MLKISFILPCYNTGKYLCQCVESLLVQGFDKDEYEIICVDNAATDNTAELLKEMSVRYPEVKVVTLPVNKCSGGAYNAGLEVAQGKYIQFVDSDDYLKEGAALLLYQQTEKENLDVLYFNIETFKGELELTFQDNLSCNGNYPDRFYAENGNDYLKKALNFLPYSALPVPAYRKMIRRSVLIDNNIYFTPTTFGCDYLHNQQLLSYAKRIGVNTEKYYMFRNNPKGVTNSPFSANAIIYALNNYSQAYKEVSETPFDEDIKHQLTINNRALLDSFVGAMKYIAYAERTSVIRGLKDYALLKSLPHSYINTALLTNGFVSRFLLKSSMLRKVSEIRRLF